MRSESARDGLKLTVVRRLNSKVNRYTVLLDPVHNFDFPCAISTMLPELVKVTSCSLLINSSCPAVFSFENDADTRSWAIPLDARFAVRMQTECRLYSDLW